VAFSFCSRALGFAVELSDPAAVVGPLEQGLSLLRPTADVTLAAMPAYLGYVPSHGLPSSDLPLVIGAAPAHVIPAVPLKPSPRIFVVDPALLDPVSQRLGSADFEVVETRVMILRRELRMREPGWGKLRLAICHVLAAKDTEREHLLRGQVRSESRMKASADGLCSGVTIALLHQIVDHDLDRFRSGSPVVPHPCRVPNRV
jgi:hypothetical protein